ncbi:uncharacterized protein [Bemisia tabaci]|uniref:uncharacterized protein n=1 Tax=Bemisia tabaci TaxID=7038 RepID=UPI003B28CC13
MIYKVLIFAAATLITVDARAFPDASGKTLEQLIGELKDIEKVRHDAIVKAAEKPQFKADENMVRYLATWTEYDALLIEIRKALKDIPWLLDGDRLEATYKQDPRKAFPFSVLRSPDGLIEDLEPLEVERHWAVVATMKMHELKDDQLKSKFLSTWSEFDAGLAIARKVFTEIIGLLKSGQEGQAQQIADDFKILRARAQVVEGKLMRETKDVPAEFLMDKDFVTVWDALNAGSIKLVQIGLGMLIEVTSNLFKKSLEPAVVSARRAVLADNYVM